MTEVNERDDRSEPSVLDRLLGAERADGDEETPELDPTAHSVKLLYDNFIKAQLNTPLTPANVEVRPKDFLSAIAAKVQMLEAKADGDETLAEVKGAYRAILLDLLSTLECKFGFDSSERGGPALDDADMDTLAASVHNLYNFMVLDRVENIVAYLKVRIFQNRKALAKAYKPRMQDRKNMSMASLKNSLAVFDDVVVMFFLDDIVKQTASEHEPFSSFVGALESEFQDEVSLVGTGRVVDGDNEDFVAKYLAPALASTEMTMEFTRMVSMALLQVLPQKPAAVPGALRERKEDEK